MEDNDHQDRIKKMLREVTELKEYHEVASDEKEWKKTKKELQNNLELMLTAIEYEEYGTAISTIAELQSELESLRDDIEHF